MHKKQKNKLWFILYALFLGGATAILSVISDNLQFIYLDGPITTPRFIISYLAIMFDSLPIWFLLAMITGRIFGKNIKSAATYSTIYTLIAITIYFVIGSSYSGGPNILALGLKSLAYVLITWYGASVLGGILGGITGFVFRSKPYVLLIFPAGVILQLCINGTRAWVDTIGIAQSTTYCLMLAISLWYFYILNKKKVNLN
ncbi:hypothetical protein ACFC4S_23080 [Priestia megaterium]|uniref:hypothetical protein n=1 Tax=Priestia megaterium TaxID=1404 RepID=UPI0035DF1AB1